eukprot:Gb_13046 [translate_table: standard]
MLKRYPIPAPYDRPLKKIVSPDRDAAVSRTCIVKDGVSIDAFTDTPYHGNPAAVCLLEESKETEWMQKVANEFNLSETAFLRRRVSTSGPVHENGNLSDNNEEFDLRWFTPSIEVGYFRVPS